MTFYCIMHGMHPHKSLASLMLIIKASLIFPKIIAICVFWVRFQIQCLWYYFIQESNIFKSYAYYYGFIDLPWYSRYMSVLGQILHIMSVVLLHPRVEYFFYLCNINVLANVVRSRQLMWIESRSVLLKSRGFL